MTKIVVDCALGDYNINLTRALNSYNLDYDLKEAKRLLQEYSKKNELKVDVSSVADGAIKTTMGWVAALIMNGSRLQDSHVKQLETYIKSLSSKEKKPVTKNISRPSIQDATNNVINEYLGKLEWVFDQLYLAQIKTFDLYSDLKANQLPKQAVASVQEWIKEKMRYFLSVYESKDEQVKEAYASKSKKTLKKMLEELASWIPQAAKYGEFKLANRKPRKKKEKAPAVQVAKLQYLRECTELDIKSINPADLIGCTQLLAFNVKTRKIMLFRTESASGIKCKGSTLQNYEPELSVQKTLRKPPEQLKELLSLSKVQTRKFIENIKARESSVRGRINKDTLILRAMK
jgi:predicted metal-binding protein